MGDGYISMITSIVTQLVFLIPCAWLFGKISGLDSIWWSFAVAEIAALLITLYYFTKELKKLDF